MRRMRAAGAVLVLAVLTGLLYVGGVGEGSGRSNAAPGSPSVTLGPPADSRTAVERDRASGLPLVDLGSLPREAQRTVELIDRGGPFPYDRDGSIFGNRERLLPRQPGGYYREYTVPTPGSDDRGARRIVAGDAGELFYTDDHYASFVAVRR